MRAGNWKIDKSPSTRNEYRRAWFKKVREEIVQTLGGACEECGYADVRALQIDHKYGDARTDKRKKGISYYYNIRKRLNTGRYQVLCANCNTIKRGVKQECSLSGMDGPNPDRSEGCS